jgi:ribosomal protein L37AE/L43A
VNIDGNYDQHFIEQILKGCPYCKARACKRIDGEPYLWRCEACKGLFSSTDVRRQLDEQEQAKPKEPA